MFDVAKLLQYGVKTCLLKTLWPEGPAVDARTVVLRPLISMPGHSTVRMYWLTAVGTVKIVMATVKCSLEMKSD